MSFGFIVPQVIRMSSIDEHSNAEPRAIWKKRFLLDETTSRSKDYFFDYDYDYDYGHDYEHDYEHEHEHEHEYEHGYG